MGTSFQSIRLVCLCALLLTGVSSGCNRLFHRGQSTAVPYTTRPTADGAFDEHAKHLNSKGLRSFEAGNLPKAEEYLREALEADVNFGPAHNNLGQIYLARHQLYLAAWEFEYAANLMPELAEPLINQGLAYETAERIDRAAEIYQIAYTKFPHHPHAISSLVRARIKQDANPDEIGFLLDELIMHDGRQEWVEWAKELRATQYRTSCSDCFVEEYEHETTPGGPVTIGATTPDQGSRDSDAAETVLEGPIPSDITPARLPIILPGESSWVPNNLTKKAGEGPTTETDIENLETPLNSGRSSIWAVPQDGGSLGSLFQFDE